jgi:hypothetical protein
MRKILEDFLFAAASFFLLLIVSNSNAIVPVPAEDQSGPIAILGAVIHIGNGQVIGDGIITFDEGIITAIGSLSDGINTAGHLLIELQGQHLYPGFVLANTTLGLLEVGSIRATADVFEEGDINASVRSAIAYNTDSEIIPTQRFNGILTAQVAPEGGLISGSSSVFKLDGWNWEDALLYPDVGIHCIGLHLLNDGVIRKQVYSKLLIMKTMTDRSSYYIHYSKMLKVILVSH